MKPGDVSELLGIARSTVTKWTSQEYKLYFTPGAQGGDGRNREFTDLDVRIMYLIKTLKDSNTPADQIHQRLREARAGDWQDVPDLPPSRPSANVAVIPTAAADAALSAQERGYLNEIRLLNDRVDELKAELESRRGSEERLLRELGDLRREQGRMEIELELWRSGRLKSDGGAAGS